MSSLHRFPNEEPSLSMFETWIRALTRPTEATYTEIANDPEAGPSRAYMWIFSSTLIGSIFYLMVSSLLGTAAFDAADIPPGPILLALICALPFGALSSVLGIMLNTAIINAIARMLGGRGTYKKLVYTFAAYMAPLSLVSAILGIIPVVNCLAMPLGLYGLFLNVVAVKAVHKFSWISAIVASLLIVVLAIFFIAVIVIAALSILGPELGDVFYEIMNELGPLVP